MIRRENFKRFLCVAFWLAMIVFAFGRIGHAATYYVSQSGTEPKATATISDAPMSVSTHNSSAFAAGDIIYILGTITSQLIINDDGAAGNVITYRGDYSGNVSDINWNGNPQIKLDGADYIVIDGLNMRNGQIGLASQGSSDYVTIKNCTIHTMTTKGILFQRSATYYSGSDTLADNTYITIGGTIDDGNEIYNVGNNTGGSDISFAKVTDWVISYNQLYATGTTLGVDGLTIHQSARGLIEHNLIHSHNSATGGEDGIDLKENTNNVIVRQNHIYNHTRQSGITVQMGTYSIDIYANVIHGNAWAGVLVKKGSGTYSPGNMSDINIWSNLIYSNASGVMVQNSGDYAITITDVEVYSNTFAFNGGTNAYQGAGITTQLGNGHIAKNNIFYGNTCVSGGSDPYQQVLAGTGQITLDGNLYYFAGQTGPDIVTIGSTDYTLTELKAAGSEANGVEADPKFVDAANDDYTLDGTYVDNGFAVVSGPGSVTIQGVAYANLYSDSIDPDSAFEAGELPTISSVNQSDYGSDFEFGAFVFTTNYPNATITSPVGNQTIEEGESLTFTSDVTCTTNTPCTYLWNFDGGAVNSTSEDAGATAFATAGVYNVTLTVTDAASVADPTPAQVTVTVRAATGVNDYTGNTNVKGLWVFESNLNDTSGNSNNLTGSGSPAYDSSTEIEGDYSLDLEAESSQFASIADASLASGFTFKGDTTEAPWTLLAKFKLESLPAVGARMVIASKYGYTDNLRSFYLGVENVGGTTYPTFSIGYANGVSNKPEFHGSGVSAGVNYAIVLVFNNATDEYTFALYNLDTAAVVGTNATGDLTSTVNGGWCNTAASFDIGKIGPNNTYYFDGLIDEVVVLSQEFSTTEISAYFAGNYSVSTAEIVRIYSSTPTGYYKEGDTTAPFFVEFADAISWSVGAGSITLTLVNDTGDDVAVNATYASGSGSTIEFDGLVVPDGFNTADLDAVALAAAGGATIKVSGTTTDADLTVPTDPDSRSLDRNGRIVIDDTADTIASVVGVSDDASSFTDPDGYIDIAVNLPSTDGYHVGYTTAWPKVPLTVGAETLYAEYVGRTDANTLVFRLELEPGNRDPDGIEIAGDLVLTGAMLTDMAGNTISLTMPASPNTLADDSTYVVAVPKGLSTATAWWVGTGFDAATFDLLDLVDGDRILIAE